MRPLHLTDASFKKEVLESDLPVLVDFWAPWCGPCQTVAPVIDEITKEYSQRIKVGKVNVEESPKIATQFGVMSIPTFIFFKGGKVMEQAVGALNKVELKRKIEHNL
jgi:thioredoxin 1